jgi:malate synthase
VPLSETTEKTLKKNIDILFEYVYAWLDGNGCVPLNNLMEDAATAEISRAQIWQWLKYEVVLDNRVVLNKAHFNQVFRGQMVKYRKLKNYMKVSDLVQEFCLADKLDDFLTTKCYELID